MCAICGQKNDNGLKVKHVYLNYNDNEQYNICVDCKESGFYYDEIRNVTSKEYSTLVKNSLGITNTIKENKTSNTIVGGRFASIKRVERGQAQRQRMARNN